MSIMQITPDAVANTFLVEVQGGVDPLAKYGWSFELRSHNGPILRVRVDSNTLAEIKKEVDRAIAFMERSQRA
jgi:hypothetical protein